MKRSNKTQAEKDAENRLAVKILIGFYSISGFVIGAIAVLFLKNLVLNLVGLELTWWYGALFGLLIGIPSGVVQARRILRENHGFAQAAERLGLMELCDDDVSRVHRETNFLVSGYDCRIWNCFFQPHDEGFVVLCESGFEERDDEHGGEMQQTTAYFEFDTIRFPEFQIQPASRGMRIAASILGSTQVAITNETTFTRKYVASGPDSESIRQLIDRELLRHLLPDGAWHVYARTNRLLIFRMGERVPLERLGGFLKTTATIADALVGKAATISPAAQSETMTREKAIDRASAIGGLAGILLKRQMNREAIDAKGMQEFVNQTPPRQIPAPLLNQFSMDSFLKWFAVATSALGFVLVAVAVLVPASDSSSRSFTLIAGCGLAAAGMSGLLMMFRSMSRKRQILRNGKLRLATIESVDQAPYVSGNLQVYRVTIRFTDDSSEMSGTALLKGASAMTALNLMERARPIRVLQNTRDPRQLILIDCHAVL